MKRATGKRREQLWAMLAKANQMSDELRDKRRTVHRQIDDIYTELYAPETDAAEEEDA